MTHADPGYARWSCGPLPAWLSLHPHRRLSPRTARSSHNEQPGRALCPPPGKLPASFRGGCHPRLWDASPDPSSWAVPLPGLGFHQTEGWKNRPQTPQTPVGRAAWVRMWGRVCVMETYSPHGSGTPFPSPQYPLVQHPTQGDPTSHLHLHSPTCSASPHCTPGRRGVST